MEFSLHYAIYLFGQLAVFVFALTGALAAAKRELDIFAFIFVGCITGLGGGSLRDLLLNTDSIFWIEDPLYLSVCVVASIATYFIAEWVIKIDRFLLWMDAAGIALFAVLGTEKALSYGCTPLVAILMGVITSTVGSVIRDLLLQQKILIFEPEIYVTACLLGSVSYVTLIMLGSPDLLALLLASLLAFGLRIFAINLDLRFPRYRLSKQQSNTLDE